MLSERNTVLWDKENEEEGKEDRSESGSRVHRRLT